MRNVIFPSILAFFTLGNSHPLIVTLYSLWRSMMVLKKKRKKKGGRQGRRDRWGERKGEREGGREGGRDGGGELMKGTQDSI